MALVEGAGDGSIITRRASDKLEVGGTQFEGSDFSFYFVTGSDGMEVVPRERLHSRSQEDDQS